MITFSFLKYELNSILVISNWDLKITLSYWIFFGVKQVNWAMIPQNVWPSIEEKDKIAVYLQVI